MNKSGKIASCSPLRDSVRLRTVGVKLRLVVVLAAISMDAMLREMESEGLEVGAMASLMGLGLPGLIQRRVDVVPLNYHKDDHRCTGRRFQDAPH
jgi:hypothetical protein